jgi:hypothetical protein
MDTKTLSTINPILYLREATMVFTIAVHKDTTSLTLNLRGTIIMGAITFVSIFSFLFGLGVSETTKHYYVCA